MKRRDDQRPPWMVREPPTIAGRVPPHDLDAEAAVLSAIMLDPAALDAVVSPTEPNDEALLEEHFYSEANRLIFEACKALSIAGSPFDVVTVGSWLRAREQLPRIGGAAYLGQLVDATPAVANVVTHARVVIGRWRLRRIIKVCQHFAGHGYGDCGDVNEFGDALEQAIHDIVHRHKRSALRGLKHVMVDRMREIAAAAESGSRVTGVPTRFTDIDKKTGGMHPGDLEIVAARPGMGKTAYVCCVAANVAAPVEISVPREGGYGSDTVKRHPWGVAFFSLEMPKAQISDRLVCSEARIDLGKLRQGYLSQDDWQRMTAAASELGRWPIWIDDTTPLTVMELRAKVRHLQAELQRRGTYDGLEAEALGLVVVDYLQLMQGNRYTTSREQEISEISRGLKGLAKELRVPVIALSALNRGVETRATKSKRPLLSDLRESGAIESDADTIVFIYRDSYYNRDSQDRGIAELIIAKQRNGPTGTVRVRFVDSYTRFENLAPGEYESLGDEAAE